MRGPDRGYNCLKEVVKKHKIILCKGKLELMAKQSQNCLHAGEGVKSREVNRAYTKQDRMCPGQSSRYEGEL